MKFPAGFRRCAASLVFLLSLSSLSAQERAGFGQPLLASYFSVYLRPSSFTIPSIATARQPNFGEPLLSPEDSRWKELFARGSLQSGRAGEFKFFRKQMPTRFSYHASADFNTGYGQFFSTDAFGRSRIRGAGIQEPDWVYLKMSFKF